MKIKNLYILLVALISFSCVQDATVEENLIRDGVRLNFTSSRLASLGMEKENHIYNVTAYCFENELLHEIVDLVPDEFGNTTLKLQDRNGDIYFVANKEGVEVLESAAVGKTKLADFMGIIATGEELKTDGLLMTASIPAKDMHDGMAISMRRALGRIDVEAKQKGVSVKQVLIENAADAGFLWAKETVSSPESTTFTKKYTRKYDQPVTESTAVAAYVYEQASENLKATVWIDWAGGEHILKANLPKTIKRNTVYSLRVKSEGAGMALEVIAEEGWENGNGSESKPVQEPVIDRKSIEGQKGVRLNETADTLFIPHSKNDFSITLFTEDGEQVLVDGSADGATVEVANPQSVNGTQVRITNQFKMPGEMEGLVYLQVVKGQENKRRAVLVFEDNPIVLESTRLRFDDKAVSDFDAYAEGDFGTISLPKGATIKLEFSDSKAQWMKLEPVAGKEQSYRILGGWRPNDPTADGRVQEATLVITPQNLPAERYTIRRKNYGLPVVNINGTWWCKYNLRGNANSFDDQVSIADDEKFGGNVLAYLQQASNDELYNLISYQYQGGNVQGLKLSHNGTHFYYNGMTDNAKDLADLPAGYMAPEGYQLPDYAQWRFFGRGDNNDLGKDGTYDNGLGQKITLTYVVKDVDFLSKKYGQTAFYEFKYGDQVFVLYGLGHQWDTKPGNITFKAAQVLLGTTTKGKTWVMESWFRDSSTNWFKCEGQNVKKTRTLRCIKTPVEYMY